MRTVALIKTAQMMRKIFYFLLAMSLFGCVSGKPDCDDISSQQLQNGLKTFMIQAIRSDMETKRDSIITEFKKAGFNNRSIFPPDNPTPKYDSLKRSFYLHMKRLDTLSQNKLSSIILKTDNIIVEKTGELLFEDENISLTTFHCTCEAEYLLKDYNGKFNYRLTRHDWDPKTYLKITYAKLPK